MRLKVSKKFINNLHIALGFTVLFAANNTQSHIQKMLLLSIQNDDPEYHADGHVCFGITYALQSVSMWLAPSAMALIGWRGCLTIGALCYASFAVYDYFGGVWLTYAGSAICGFGSALLWTGQATYIVLNSEIGSVRDSISLFWIFYQVSFFLGNPLVYYLFQDPHQPIDRIMRQKISILLGAAVLCAVVILSLLQRPIRQEQNDEMRITVRGEIVNAFRVLRTKQMLFANFIFVSCGLNLTFTSVLAVSLGFSQYLSTNSKKYAPLSGVMHGVGEVIGSLFSAYMKDKSLCKLRVIPIACTLTIVSYMICFVGLPNTSAFIYTRDKPLIELSVYYFLLANVLCGFGDACFHIELYNCMGHLYPNNCAPAFAVFKFVRSAATGISFFYSSYVGLQIQTAILTMFSVLAFIAYYCAWYK